MQWLDVKGQLRAMRMLQMAYAGGRMPHAWLFYGPSGAGKEMLATRFARLLLCERPVTIEPPAEARVEGPWQDGCGQCKSCRLIASSVSNPKASVHPDLHLIYRALNEFHPDSTVKNRKALDLSVDVIRHFLLEPVRGRSAMGKAKTYIVREAELLSLAAQNALLKTLEEPPPDTYIILLSTTRDRLLPTTISRCQSVGFGTLDVATTEQIIAGCGVGPAEASFHAALSEGRPGWALYLAKMNLRADYLAIADGVAKIGAADPMQVGGVWQEVTQRWVKALQDDDDADPTTDQNRQGLQVLLMVLNSILRDALRLGAAARARPVLAESLGSLKELVAHWPAQGLTGGVKQVAWAESAIARNANTALTLEALAVKLAQCSRGVVAGSPSAGMGGPAN